MRWNQGRATIERMLKTGELQRVTASRDFADRLIADAITKLASAARLSPDDPGTAYDALYGAARQALTAVLENQGLRPTQRGGHIAPYEAVRAQLDPPMGKILRPFDRMRVQRHDVDYPTASTPLITTDDVLRDLPAAAAIVDVAEDVLDQMDVF
jgi:hypothetical protein